jgi:nucleoid DNA-binding protein
MKKQLLAQAVAGKQCLTEGAAKDQVDEAVRAVLRKLRQGRQVKLAGVGSLVPKSR